MSEGQGSHGKDSRIKSARVLFERPAVLQKSGANGRWSTQSQLSGHRNLPSKQHQHTKKRREEVE